MRFTFSLLAAVVLALEVNASDFQAFSGSSCDGSAGDVVSCVDACGDFTGRHSFIISDGTAGDVVFFTGAGCTGESFNFGSEGSGECINVNTGTNIQSFVC
ncbi:hypothetical protein B0H11DRAFT_1732979 [Mycena galericulata]|nr:hypothetical protein B0H11DRAFT_1732979 [Mycena galericulata]